MASGTFRLTILFLCLFGAAVPAWADKYVGTGKAKKILVTGTAGNGQPRSSLRTNTSVIFSEVTCTTLSMRQ